MPNEILDTMREEYEKRSKNDPKLSQIRKQIKEGATYREAEVYGTRSGEILSGVFKDNITEDVFNDSLIVLEDLIVPMMETNYNRVVSATSSVQSSLNKSANIGIKPIEPEFDTDAAVNLVYKMMEYDSFEEAEWLLGDPVVTNSLGIVTDMLHANADFHYKAGMSPKIVRTAEPDCCKWCADLEGVYEYGNLSSSDDVWKRHANCRCEVTYVPGDGRAQDSWSKEWKADADVKRVEDRIRLSEKLSKGKAKSDEKDLMIRKLLGNGNDTDHSKKRKKERNIDDRAVEHTIRNPLNPSPEKHIDYDELGRPSIRYIGEKITVIVNPDTYDIITVRRTTISERKRWKKN